VDVDEYGMRMRKLIQC